MAPAKVIAKTAPQSHTIKTMIGQMYWRNRRHLRKSKNNSTQAEPEDLSDDDMSVSDDQDSNEVTVEPESPHQDLSLSQPINLRRSQRIRARLSVNNRSTTENLSSGHYNFRCVTAQLPICFLEGASFPTCCLYICSLQSFISGCLHSFTPIPSLPAATQHLRIIT